MDVWIAEAVGKMHIHKIKQKDVAKKTGYTREYIGMILRGIKASDKAKVKIESAIEEIIAEKNQQEA